MRNYLSRLFSRASVTNVSVTATTNIVHDNADTLYHQANIIAEQDDRIEELLEANTRYWLELQERGNRILEVEAKIDELKQIPSAERKAASEIYSSLKEVTDLLRAEAPGTKLNNRRFLNIASSAYAALRAYENEIQAREAQIPVAA